MLHATSSRIEDMDVRPQLSVVPAPETTHDLPAGGGVFEDDFDTLPPELSTSWPESSFEQWLLALGYPVAVAVGDDLPEQIDESADVHEAAVVNIESARVRRFLAEMDPLISKAMRLSWGLDGPSYSQDQIAERMGLTRAIVRRLLDEGLAELRVRFGVAHPAAT